RTTSPCRATPSVNAITCAAAYGIGCACWTSASAKCSTPSNVVLPPSRAVSSHRRREVLLQFAVHTLARMRVTLGFLAGGFVLALAHPTARSLAAGLSIAALGEALRIWASGHLNKAR